MCHEHAPFEQMVTQSYYIHLKWEIKKALMHFACMYIFVSRGGQAWALQIKIPQILHPSKLIKKLVNVYFITMFISLL